MKFIKLIDSLTIQIEKYKPLIEFVILIAGIFGIKNKNLITTIGLYLLGFIIVVSILSYIRKSIARNNDLSFVRTFFQGSDWKVIKEEVDIQLLSLTGNPNKRNIRKGELINLAVLKILTSKRVGTTIM